MIKAYEYTVDRRLVEIEITKEEYEEFFKQP